MLTNRSYHTKIYQIVVRYWLIDLLISVSLYIAFRLTIINIAAAGNSFSATIFSILDILLNLVFSLMYLVTMVACSLTIFLNRIKKIRDNGSLSWLSFSGLPFLLTTALIITFYQDGRSHKVDLTTKALLFSAIYVVSTTMLFFSFQRRYRALSKAINIDRNAIPQT
ncbi:hypothetical protein LLH06_13195 [Mucilaginibacter daejeonensis]|uniref:hypothetical protein n=1 Tax=Mucilaginibacter daejeonensis TaxID=398049 RepID=UPI001D1765C1|nr:hypothetical protein [Mucilaginibacter daejeonensis]UEG51917.1 hypothetical protein LLH06_13195 [Mucilaginibacter daejeonensis]